MPLILLVRMVHVFWSSDYMVHVFGPQISPVYETLFVWILMSVAGWSATVLLTFEECMRQEWMRWTGKHEIMLK